MPGMATPEDFAAARNGDVEARNRIVSEHYCEIEKAAAKVCGARRWLSRDDLEQEGVFAMMRAIDRFDPERGIPFGAYASQRLKGAMLDYARTDGPIPRNILSDRTTATKVSDELSQSLGRAPTEDEVSEASGLSVKRLRELDGRYTQNAVSIDEAPVGTDFEGWDLEATYGRPDHDYALDGDLVAEAIELLPERQRAIMALHYYLGQTAVQIAPLLEVSPSRVTQLRDQALRSIREYLLANA